MAIYRITYNNIFPKVGNAISEDLIFIIFSPEELDFNSLNSLPNFYLQWLECKWLTSTVPNSNPNRIIKKSKKKRLYKIDRAVFWMEKSANQVLHCKEMRLLSVFDDRAPWREVNEYYS